MNLAIPKGRLQADVLVAMERFPALQGFSPLLSPTGRCYRARRHLPGGDVVNATLIKPRAIPQLVGLGYFDLGFVGLDLLKEASVPGVVPILDLGLNRVQIVVAVPQAKRDVLESPPKRPLVLATEYPNLANAWAHRHGLSCIIVETFGGTEAYVPEIADIVIDCVETGATLKANGLVAVETLLSSSTHVVAQEGGRDLSHYFT